MREPQTLKLSSILSKFSSKPNAQNYHSLGSLLIPDTGLCSYLLVSGSFKMNLACLMRSKICPFTLSMCLIRGTPKRRFYLKLGLGLLSIGS
jgi:hypothetical protein